MTATEKATAKIASLTAEQLFGAWEYTQYSHIEPETSITRGWLMDEIEKRYPEGFDAWLDQEAPEDSDLPCKSYVPFLLPLCGREHRQLVRQGQQVQRQF